MFHHSHFTKLLFLLLYKKTKYFSQLYRRAHHHTINFTNMYNHFAHLLIFRLYHFWYTILYRYICNIHNIMFNAINILSWVEYLSVINMKFESYIHSVYRRDLSPIQLSTKYKTQQLTFQASHLYHPGWSRSPDTGPYNLVASTHLQGRRVSTTDRWVWLLVEILQVQKM